MDWEGFQFELGAQGNSIATEAAFHCLAAADASMCDEVVANPPPLFPGIREGRPAPLHPAGSGASSRSGGIDDGADGDHDPEVLIARLAQLSTRISSLRRACSALVKNWTSSAFECPMPPGGGHGRGGPPPLIHDAVFQSVATWLARGPTDTMPPCSPETPHACWAQMPKTRTLGDLLYHSFSTSYHLLELLQHVPMSSSASNPTTVSTPEFRSQLMGFAISPLSMDGSGAPLTPEYGATSSWTSPSASPTASSNHAARHLLIASHTMLLNIYSDVLDLLQRCAGPSPSEGSTPLRDIRLVSVVQLCSFLIDCQHQAVDVYLSSSITGPPEREAGPDAMDTEVMKALSAMRAEMGQRILSLQQMLRI
jgi:hypothetical protein